jgi:SulP family sulfate permease
VLLKGVALALVSSIQSLLSIPSAERLTGQRHDGNRELVVQGAGNMASAIFGGAPSGGSPNVTQTVRASNGRTSFANLAHAASLPALSYGLGRQPAGFRFRSWPAWSS